jgi:hypothetical protein
MNLFSFFNLTRSSPPRKNGEEEKVNTSIVSNPSVADEETVDPNIGLINDAEVKEVAEEKKGVVGVKVDQKGKEKGKEKRSIRSSSSKDGDVEKDTEKEKEKGKTVSTMGTRQTGSLKRISMDNDSTNDAKHTIKRKGGVPGKADKLRQKSENGDDLTDEEKRFLESNDRIAEQKKHRRYVGKFGDWFIRSADLMPVNSTRQNVFELFMKSHNGEYMEHLAERFVSENIRMRNSPKMTAPYNFKTLSIEHQNLETKIEATKNKTVKVKKEKQGKEKEGNTNGDHDRSDEDEPNGGSGTNNSDRASSTSGNKDNDPSSSSQSKQRSLGKKEEDKEEGKRKRKRENPPSSSQSKQRNLGKGEGKALAMIKYVGNRVERSQTTRKGTPNRSKLVGAAANVSSSYSPRALEAASALSGLGGSEYCGAAKLVDISMFINLNLSKYKGLNRSFYPSVNLQHEISHTTADMMMGDNYFKDVEFRFVVIIRAHLQHCMNLLKSKKKSIDGFWEQYRLLHNEDIKKGGAKFQRSTSSDLWPTSAKEVEEEEERIHQRIILNLAMKTPEKGR